MHTDNRCYRSVVMKDGWEWKVIPLFDDSGDVAIPTLLLLKNAKQFAYLLYLFHLSLIIVS